MFLISISLIIWLIAYTLIETFKIKKDDDDMELTECNTFRKMTWLISSVMIVVSIVVAYKSSPDNMWLSVETPLVSIIICLWLLMYNIFLVMQDSHSDQSKTKPSRLAIKTLSWAVIVVMLTITLLISYLKYHQTGEFWLG